MLLGITTQSGRPLGTGWSLLPLGVVATAELLRRTLPGTALLAATAALVTDQFTPGNLATLVMFTDLVYAAVLYGRPALARRVPVTTALVAAAVTVGSLALTREPEALLLGLAWALLTFAPATTGVVVRNHRDAAETARLRAQQTALLAEADRVQAVAAERARMARELHDVIANQLSAIAIHSTAALSLDDPHTTRRALTVIRENSTEGLVDMRRLIGILRDDSGGAGDSPAAPNLAGLEALVARARADGLDVHLDDCRPPGCTLPAPVELAAYRIVQESLTNALKHAAPGRVEVRLGTGDNECTVRVSSPLGHRDEPRAPGSGAGLIGMRERVALLDGTFTAGPEPAGDDLGDGNELDHTGIEPADGGAPKAAAAGAMRWTVYATLPVDPHATPAGKAAGEGGTT